jgi:hypothetical protein
VLGYCVAGTCLEDEHGCDGAKHGEEGLRGVKSSGIGMGCAGVSLGLCSWTRKNTSALSTAALYTSKSTGLGCFGKVR